MQRWRRGFVTHFVPRKFFPARRVNLRIIVSYVRLDAHGFRCNHKITKTGVDCYTTYYMLVTINHYTLCYNIVLTYNARNVPVGTPNVVLNPRHKCVLLIKTRISLHQLSIYIHGTHTHPLSSYTDLHTLNKSSPAWSE